MPSLSGTILFLEDDGATAEDFSVEFDRNLQSLIQQKDFDKVRGIIIGRFQKGTDINFEKLKYIIETNCVVVIT